MKEIEELIELQKKHSKLQDDMLLQLKKYEALQVKYGTLQDKHILILQERLNETKPFKWCQFGK